MSLDWVSFFSFPLVCSCFVHFLKKTPIKISPRAQTKSRIRSIWNFISGKANVSTRLIVKFVGRHNINRSAYYSTKVHILLKRYSFFVWSSYVAFLCGSYGFFLFLFLFQVYIWDNFSFYLSHFRCPIPQRNEILDDIHFPWCAFSNGIYCIITENPKGLKVKMLHWIQITAKTYFFEDAASDDWQ